MITADQAREMSQKKIDEKLYKDVLTVLQIGIIEAAKLGAYELEFSKVYDADYQLLEESFEHLLDELISKGFKAELTIKCRSPFTKNIILSLDWEVQE